MARRWLEVVWCGFAGRWFVGGGRVVVGSV
jgi:hypothetical protein